MIEPQQFIESARSMMGDNETGNRNAISRIYYGIYHTGYNFAFQHLKFKYSTSASLHKQLIQFYKSHNNHNLKIIGRQLEKLRNARNEADYCLNSFVSKEDARINLRLALQLISQFEQEKAKNDLKLFNAANDTDWKSS